MVFNENNHYRNQWKLNTYNDVLHMLGLSKHDRMCPASIDFLQTTYSNIYDIIMSFKHQYFQPSIQLIKNNSHCMQYMKKPIVIIWDRTSEDCPNLHVSSFCCINAPQLLLTADHWWPLPIADPISARSPVIV